MFNTFTSLENANHSQPRVTALLACKENLMAVSWHMPVSKVPFRYSVAVREENYTHHLLEQHGNFTLNFLPFEHYDVVDRMGRVHGDTVNKLEQSGLKVESKDTQGNIMLSASDFIYKCVVYDRYKNGDHTIFIADVKKIHVNEKQSGEMMLFSGRGRYATVCEESRAQK